MIALNRTTLNRRVAVARRAQAHAKREAAAGPHPVAYTIVDSPVGRLLVAATERGICSIKLGDSDAALEGRCAANSGTPPGTRHRGRSRNGSTPCSRISRARGRASSCPWTCAARRSSSAYGTRCG